MQNKITLQEWVFSILILIADNMITIIAKNGQPIFSEISKLARENNWPISEFHVKRGQLEDVFRSVTQNSQEVSQ